MTTAMMRSEDQVTVALNELAKRGYRDLQIALAIRCNPNQVRRWRRGEAHPANANLVASELNRFLEEVVANDSRGTGPEAIPAGQRHRGRDGGTSSGEVGGEAGTNQYPDLFAK